MKKGYAVLLSACFMLAATSIEAQTNTVPDSVTSVPVYSVQPESVQMADTITPPPSIAQGYKETETIKVYSGSHTGNNIIRTIEVPLPAANSRNGYYSPR